MNNKKNMPTQITLLLRTVVSFYLLYTVFSLRNAPVEHTGGERIFFLVAMLVFTIVAVVLGGFSIKALLKGEYQKPGEDEEE